MTSLAALVGAESSSVARLAAAWIGFVNFLKIHDLFPWIGR
jgi:hypothetical protein